MPWHSCWSQRTTLGQSYLPTILRQDLHWFSAAYVGLADSWASQDSLVSASYLPTGELPLQICYPPGFYVYPGDSNSGPHSCIQSTFTYKLSLQPYCLPFFLYSYHDLLRNRTSRHIITCAGPWKQCLGLGAPKWAWPQTIVETGRDVYGKSICSTTSKLRLTVTWMFSVGCPHITKDTAGHIHVLTLGIICLPTPQPSWHWKKTRLKETKG